MKLNLKADWKSWKPDYKLPKFDIYRMKATTTHSPTWLHMGAGNIFRIFVGSVQQALLDAGLTETGIIVYESYDEAIIPESFRPYDNLTLGVTLNADGSIQKEVIASIADAFCCNLLSLRDLIAKPSLQMISFTITEKGYFVDPTKVSPSPEEAKTALEEVVAGLVSRFEAKSPPLALVSMDNFAENGTKLAASVLAIAEVWLKNGKVSNEFIEYVKSLSYPWTMIDKITPRPSVEVAEMLAKDGYEDVEITETAKHTFVASFVNAESAKYLIMEDSFPNGRPPFEKISNSGVYLTDKETVRKMDQMKVCACLNPLHTILAISGMLLNYPTISQCMTDKRLVSLLRKSSQESLPVVEDPGIISPKDFLEEVLTERFPNPFIPDAPARIACDTSQKVPVRFGETLKKRKEKGLPPDELQVIPVFIALWLRYRMGKDDAGAKLELSPDPRIPSTFDVLTDLAFEEGEKVDLSPILSDANIFGLDLYSVTLDSGASLADEIKNLFCEFSKKPNAVSEYLSKIYG